MESLYDIQTFSFQEMHLLFLMFAHCCVHNIFIPTPGSFSNGQLFMLGELSVWGNYLAQIHTTFLAVLCPTNVANLSTPPHSWVHCTCHCCTLLYVVLFECPAGLYIQEPWGWFNIKMPCHQYRKFHCRGKIVLQLSSLHNGISYTGKMTYFYWLRALCSDFISCSQWAFSCWEKSVIRLPVPMYKSPHY